MDDFVNSGRTFGPAQGLAIADALKDEPINQAAPIWEATAPPEGLPAMVKRWEQFYAKAGSRLVDEI